MATDEKPRYINKLRNKYRFIIYNDKTYAEVWHMRLSRLNVMTFVGLTSLLMITIVVLLIAFTPIRELIPGYPNSKTRHTIVQNALRLDSLEQKVQRWVLYNDNLNLILSGKDPVDIEGVSDTALARRYRAIVLAHSADDSLFRKQVEELEQQNLKLAGMGTRTQSLSNLHFSSPMQGNIQNKFNPDENHFGISLVANTDSKIEASLSGTVIAAECSVGNTCSICLQHDANVITVYKCNGQLLKKTGAYVKAGDVIATTADGILEFEIWSSGTPINPEQEVVF